MEYWGNISSRISRNSEAFEVLNKCFPGTGSGTGECFAIYRKDAYHVKYIKKGELRFDFVEISLLLERSMNIIKKKNIYVIISRQLYVQYK